MKKKFNILFLIATLGLSLLIASTGFAAQNVATASTPSNASESTQDDSFYVYTDSIPSNVSKYAQDAFSLFNSHDLNAIGVDVDSSDLLLSTGFKVNLISSNDYNKYYFPVLNKNTAVALLIVDEDDGTLSYALCKEDDISTFINNTKTSESDPFNIYVTDTAVYAINNEQNTKIQEKPDSNEDNQQLDMNMLKFSPSSNAKKKVSTLPIDDSHTFDAKMSELPIRLGAGVQIGRSCDNLPCIDNRLMDGEGTCWASATAAIIEYIKYGPNSDYPSLHGEELRDKVLDKQLAEKNTYQGNVKDAKKHIKDFTGRDEKLVYWKLSWEDVKKQISQYDNPCFMVLMVDGSAEHGAVLCGYDYDSSTGKNKRMYVMDPNEEEWVVVSYGSKYTNTNGKEYKWGGTLKK